MARIMVIQHSAYEPLGLIVHTLKRLKYRIRYVNFARTPKLRLDLERYQGLVILGGAMHPNELSTYPHLAHEIDLLQQAISRRIPILGICLGSQLLNIALGGSCYELDKPEVGWSEVTLTKQHDFFSAFKPKTQVFQWHQYASKPAPNVEVILHNKHCMQAFCYQDICVGLQFHLEVDYPLVKRWLEHPNYLEQLQRHLTETDVRLTHEQTSEYLPPSLAVARPFFNQFCRLFGKTRYAFSSRSAGGDLF